MTYVILPLLGTTSLALLLLTLALLAWVHLLPETSWWSADLSVLLRAITNDLRVDGARHAIVQLGVQLRQGVR